MRSLGRSVVKYVTFKERPGWVVEANSKDLNESMEEGRKN